MKIYLLIGCMEYEGNTVIGVFSNQTDAAKIKKEYKKKAEKHPASTFDYLKIECWRTDSY